MLLATRGFGTFLAMMMVGRLMRFIEARTLIVSGLAMTAGSLFQMTGWTDLTQVPGSLRELSNHDGNADRTGNVAQ